MLDEERARTLAEIAGAPFGEMLKLRIESAAEGVARVHMPFALGLLNPGGPQAPIHGGAIATLVDTAACAAVWTLPETSQSATVALNVNYTAPAIGTDLVAEAKVRRKGRRLASLWVEVRDRSGALVADALVTYKIA